jgi:colicin import membrane protein
VFSWPELRARPAALWASLGLHAVALVLLFFSVRLTPPDTGAAAPPAFAQPKVVEAVAIDARSFDAAQQAREAEARKAREAARAEQRRREEAARRAAAERERQAETARRAEAERRRQAEQAAEREAERRRQAELERQRQAEAERRRAEQRAAEAAAEQALMAERLAEEEAAIAAAQAAERERLAAIERERRAAEEQARQAAFNRELARLRQDYAGRIRAAVESSWEKPPGNWSGYTCVVLVRQTPQGIVTGVTVERCSGGGDVYRRSVENAVLRAEPLPAAPRPEAFESEIRFTFRTPE